MKKIFSIFAAILFAGSMMATDYQLVNSTADLVAGANYVIGNAASESGLFMAVTENTNNRKSTAAITITDGKITATDDVLVLELGGETGAWTFLTTNYEGTDGYLTSAATGKNNYCKVVATAENCSYFTITFSGDAAVIKSTGRDERNILRFNPNTANNDPLFACYSSGQQAVYLFKEVADGPAPSVAKPSITGETPFFGATTVTIACTTTGASIYYTLDGSEPSATSLAYTEPFSLNETDTVKAIAILGEDVSEIAEKIFNNRAYASFEDLIAAELDNHTIVEVSFSKLEIDSFYVSGTGENAKRKGIYFTLNATAYEIYFNKGDEVVPAAWAVGGKVSGTIRGDWYEWKSIWEIVPQDNAWVWTSLTYEATPTAIDNTNAAAKAVKAIENGRLVIIKNGVRYDITGAELK